MNEQTCKICKQTMNISNFHRNRSHKNGWGNECKLCQKERHKESKERTKRIGHLKTENCDLCGKKFGKTKRNLPCADHCHETNKDRGWICFDCNLGLGKLGDNIETLQKAIKYLEKYV